MSVWAIIQARMGSERFPGKVLAPFAGMPLLARVITLTRLAATGDDWRLVLATTREPEDGVLAAWAEALAVDCVRGPTEDVLGRFLAVAQIKQLPDDDIILRVTADDPLKVPALMRAAVEGCRHDPERCHDSNHGQMTGFGAEAFTVALLRAADAVTTGGARQHVTGQMPRARVSVAATVDTVEGWRHWAGQV